MKRFFARAIAARWMIALGLAAAGVAQASEAEVRKGMEAFVGSAVVESVRPSGYGGLFEVVLKSGQLIYTDARVSFIIDGSLIDTAARKDMTAERMNQLSAIDFAKLPLDQAVKVVKGKGTRVMATFEDPNCGFCKKLGKEIAQMDDVTVYTFLYPILSEDSATKSGNIWCAKDRAKAWTDWVVAGKEPAAAKCDTAVIGRNVELGQRLRINGTPAIFFADGSRIGGFVPVAELEKALAKAPR